MLASKTKAISTRAAAQACSCRAGSGCSEYVKINTGMFGSAFVTSVCTALRRSSS